MSNASGIGSKLRSMALLVLGALVLHETRYLLAYGTGGDVGAGHGYLQALAPLLVACAAAAIAVSVAAPAIHRRMPRISDPAASTERAAAFAAALLAIFLIQETCEGLLAGSPAGALGGITAPGGWLALPLAIAFGALAESASHWLQRAELGVATAFVRPAPQPPRRLDAPTTTILVTPCSRPLAFGLCRRPPPLPAV